MQNHSNTTARDELIDGIMMHPWIRDMGGAVWPQGFCPTCSKVIDAGHNSPDHAGHIADALIADGWTRMPAAAEATIKHVPTDPIVGRIVAVEHADGHRKLGRLAAIWHDQDGTHITITEDDK